MNTTKKSSCCRECDKEEKFIINAIMNSTPTSTMSTKAASFKPKAPTESWKPEKIVPKSIKAEDDVTN